MTTTPRRSGLVSAVLHIGAIALILLVTGTKSPLIRKTHDAFFTPRDIVSEYVSPHRLNRGGGGGQNMRTPPSFGKIPRAAPRQFTPPMVVIMNENPRLPMEPTLVMPAIELPQINALNYGDPHGAAGPLSGGTGKRGGIGGGDDGGVGNRRGPGLGDGGDDGGVSAGPDGFRGATTQPIVLWKPEPAYSDEARKAKLQGVVVLQIEVDVRGQARNIQVTQSLGLGLDEKAIEAVKAWRFKPATRNSKPVPSVAQVQVTFRLL